MESDGSKSYSVGTRLKGRVTGVSFPLCRMSITPHAIILSWRLLPWSHDLEVARDDVRGIVLRRHWGGSTIASIDDEQHTFVRVRVQMQYTEEKILATLRDPGYPVVAYDRWAAYRPPWKSRDGWQKPPGRRSR